MESKSRNYHGLPHLVGYLALLALLLAACPAPSLPAASPMPAPAVVMEAKNHTPVILRVEERQATKEGKLIYYRDVYYSDAAGDAVFVKAELISGKLKGDQKVNGGSIETPADEQKHEAMVPATWVCHQQETFVLKVRIVDRAGNTSEPSLLTFPCPAPQLNTKPFLNTGLLMGFGLVLVLLVGFWLLFRQHPGERLPALRSTLLLFCLLFPLKFMLLILHEGGHALYNLVRGALIILYVHPFAFDGFSRPTIDNSIWTHVLGLAVATPAALLISLPFWKRRSLANLPLAMLFPWVVAADGLYCMLLQGDSRNLVQVTGLPGSIFIALGVLAVVSGYFLLFSLFPLLGLSPQDRKSLFVVPAAIFLWGFLSMIVAHLVVPGSPIDAEYSLAREILSGANSFFIGTIFWALLGVLYVTLFRRVYPKLPAGLRMETVSLTWKDLRIPGLLAAISVILGLIVIA